MNELMEIPPWAIWCCVAVAAFVVGLGWGLLIYPNLDHIIPLKKGGSHTRLNSQCLCHKCNIIKGSTGVGDQLRLF